MVLFQFEQSIITDNLPVDVIKVLHHNTSVKSVVNNTNNNNNNETNNMLNDKHIVSENVLLADRIVKHKVDDIRSLIGINDKFLLSIIEVI